MFEVASINLLLGDRDFIQFVLKLLHRDVLGPKVGYGMIVWGKVRVHPWFLWIELLYRRLCFESQSCIFYDIWEVRPFHFIRVQVFWATLVHLFRSLYLGQLHSNFRNSLQLLLLRFVVRIQNTFALMSIDVTTNLVLNLRKVLNNFILFASKKVKLTY